MGWKYEIVVSGEDGKNAILHRNVSVAGKMVDVLYIKRGYDKACVQLRIGSSYGLEAERWREKAKKAGLSDLGQKWQPTPSPIGKPPVSNAELKQINWVCAVQNDNGKWENHGFNTVTSRKKTIEVEEGVFETVYNSAVAVSASSTWSLGRFYWLEPYFNIPDFQKKNSIYGIYIVFFDDPQPTDISWSGCSTGETLHPVVQSYGNMVNLEIVSHRMPNDVLSDFHSFGRYYLTIFCGDKVLEKKIVLGRNIVSDVKLASRTRISLLIEPSWREAMGHKKNDGEKELRIEVEGDLMYNPRAKKTKSDNTSGLAFDTEKMNMQTKGGTGVYTKDADNGETTSIRYQHPQGEFAEPYMGHDPRAEAENMAKAISGLYMPTEKKKLSKQLRLKVWYEKKSDIQERLSENKSKMLAVVSKNDRTFKAPVNNPCKYKAIEISSPGREPYLIFEETDKGVSDLTGYTGFDLVAGESEKSPNLTIVLKDLDTKRCRKQNLSHKGDKNVFDLSKLLGVKKNDYKVSGNKLEMLLHYDYNKTYDTDLGKVGNKVVDSAWLFRYIWPRESLKQSHLVLVNSCAYPNQMVKINVYPDIMWTFHLNYGMKNPLYYRDTFVQMRQHRVEEAFNKGQAADIDGYDGKLQSTFSFALECNWNKTRTVNLDYKIAGNVKLFLGSFLKIKKFVDQVTGKDRGTSTKGFNAEMLARVKRTPLSIEVQSPQLSIAAGWKYECGRKEQRNAHKMALTGEIKAKADPLIGAEATIDLIAWGKKLHPMANVVITALDLLAYAANANVRFDLIFYGKLFIDGEATLSALKKEGELKAGGQFGFKLVLLAKATGKLKLYVTSADFDFEAKAQAAGYFSAGMSLGIDDNKGIYFKPILKHSGLKITFSYYTKIGDFRRTEKKEVTIIKAGEANIDQKFYING